MAEAMTAQELAARYLDIFVDLEQAHMSNRPDDVRRILDGVDPFDLQALAAELRRESRQFRLLAEARCVA